MSKQSLVEIRETIDELEERYAEYEYTDTELEDIKKQEEYLNNLLDNGRHNGYINDLGSPYGFGTREC